MTRMEILALPLALGLLSMNLAAQAPMVGGPRLGSAYDPATRSVRAMLGFPGGAHLAGSVADDLDFALPSPDGKAALARRGSETYLIRGLAGVAVDWQRLTVAEIELGAWAPDNSGAAVWSPESGIVWVDPADGSVTVLAEASRLPGVKAIAAARGQRVAVAAGGIYLIEGSSDPRLQSPGGEWGALAFSPDGRDLYAAGDDGTLTEIRAAGDGAQIASYRFSPEPGRSSGLAVSTDPGARVVYVADASARKLHVIDVASGSVQSSTDLDADPTRMQAVGENLYLLSQRAKEADIVLLLDARGAGNVYFVPAGGAQ